MVVAPWFGAFARWLMVGIKALVETKAKRRFKKGPV
jgi:hypothetical protein